MMRAALDSGHPFLAGITLEELEREDFVRLRLPEPFLPFSAGGFGTPSGKCEFRAETLDYTPPVESRLGAARLQERFPLELISPKGSGMNSSFGNRQETDAAAEVITLHPADAARRGIAAGDRVRVYNDRGACELTACVEESVAPGVLSTLAIRWGKRAPDGQNVNALTSDRLTDRGGGPVFYNCLVEVEKT
jgi:anaerobic selenocysteine-containing dehydrogenase